MIDPLVEKIARAMAARGGRDPDEMVPETGYPDARMIPRWHRELWWAESHVIAQRVIADEVAA